HVPTLQGVVAPLFLRSVVQNPRVLELLVVAEQRLDEELLGPAHAVAHRADDRVRTDHDADVSREKQVGERRQRVPHLVQRPRDGPRLLERTLDHEGDELLGRQLGQPPRQDVRGHHLQGPRDQELPHVGPGDELRQQVPYLVHLREALQHGHELSVLLLRQVEVDDVVVEVVFPVPRGDGDELATRRVHEYGPQRADFGGDVDAGHGRNLTGRRQLRIGDCGLRIGKVNVVTRGTPGENPQSEIRNLQLLFYRFANAKLSVSSSAAMLTDFTITSGGTASWTGAKLRIAFTPDCTSSSTTCCAASAGVTTIAMSVDSFLRSDAICRTSRTTRPFQRDPTFF